MTVALVLSSAALLAVALPNEIVDWGVPLAGVVALVPLYVALLRVSTPRNAARLGAIFGAVSTLLSNYWLAFYGEFSIWTIGGAVVGYTLYNSILFAFIHHIVRSLDGARVWRPLAFAVVWTAYEYLKSVGFLGYPWGLIAYPFGEFAPLAQIVDVTGIWGLSFLAAWTNATIGEITVSPHAASSPLWGPGAAASGPGRIDAERITVATETASLAGGAGANAAAVILSLLVVSGYGLARIAAIAPRDTVRVILVQQNADSWAPGAFPEALDQAQRLTLDTLGDEEGIDFVVWSETALRRPYPDPRFYGSTPSRLPFSAFLRRIAVPLVTGVPLFVEGSQRDLHNGAIAITPTGELAGVYAKQQLVPFAESIPYWERPGVQRFFREVIGLYGTWVPGSASEVIELPLRDGTLRIGTPICFEDGFGWVPREMALGGADLLVNVTNNSWSRRVSAQTQHMQVARYRSIETRRALVRGTNSGFTGVVDAAGRVTGGLPMFEATAGAFDVPLYAPVTTVYMYIGDSVGIAMVIMTIGYAILVWSRGAIARGDRVSP